MTKIKENEKIKWGLIPNTNGRYLISKTGTVINIQTGSELKHTKMTGDGNNTYEYVTIKFVDKPYVGIGVHRLLAMTFIPNPDNLPCVDHIDDDPSNNDLSNLHWVTHSQNHSKLAAKAKSSASHIAANKRPEVRQHRSEGQRMRWQRARVCNELNGLRADIEDRAAAIEDVLGSLEETIKAQEVR